MALHTKQLFISGKVQGVGYRHFALKQALAHQVTGFARNLTDGRVEVVAQADETTLRAYIEQLRQGPPLSQVEDVKVVAVNISRMWDDFKVIASGAQPSGEF